MSSKRIIYIVMPMMLLGALLSGCESPDQQIATVAPTATPTPTITPTATPTTTPTPTPTPIPVSFGPADGFIPHDDDGTYEAQFAGVRLSDVRIEATFYPAVARYTGTCDIAFLFRFQDADSHYRLVVDYCAPQGPPERNWELVAVQDGVADVVQSGEFIDSIPVYYRSNQPNEMKLMAIGDDGYFFWNAYIVEILDLSWISAEGDVGLATGFEEGHETVGAETSFEQFIVRPLIPLFDPVSVEIFHDQDDEIEIECGDVELADFIALTDFYIPETGADWDVGYVFRAASDEHFRLNITSHTAFKYYDLYHVTAGFNHVQGSYARAVQDARGARNSLDLIVTNRWGYLIINGFVHRRLDLNRLMSAGDVCIGTGMYFGREVVGHSTQFEGFTVINLGNEFVEPADAAGQISSIDGDEEPEATPPPIPVPGPLTGSPVFMDEFDGSLDSSWEWLNQDPSLWSLEEHPGSLRVRLSDPDQGGLSYLLQDAPEGDFELVTEVAFNPSINFQRVGIAIWENEQDAIAFVRGYCDLPYCAQDGLAYYQQYGWTPADPNFPTDIPEVDSVILRLSVVGNQMLAYYSLDGDEWSPVGVHPRPEGSIRIGLMIGQSSEPIHADFEYFAIYGLD